MPKKTGVGSGNGDRKDSTMKKDLSGLTFGTWKVLRPSTKNTPTSKTYWLCVCGCGKEYDVWAYSLLKGQSSCCVKCRHKKQFCVKGHDTYVCGRHKTGGCRVCSKEKNLLRSYGITLEEYNTLFDFQGGKCAICGRELDRVAFVKEIDIPVNKKGRAEVDHKHIPKKQKIKPPKKDTVRGILCGGRWGGCNSHLGRKDNAEWLKAALSYIENPPASRLFGKAK